MIGFYALFAGVMYLAIGLRLRSLDKTLETASTTALAPPPDGPARKATGHPERTSNTRKEIEMDFNKQVDDLQDRVEQLKDLRGGGRQGEPRAADKRIDQAQADTARTLAEAKQQPTPPPKGPVVMGAEPLRRAGPPGRVEGQGAASRRPGRRRLRRLRRGSGRGGRLRAIDYADWAVENARLAILDAIDARVTADEKSASLV